MKENEICSVWLGKSHCDFGVKKRRAQRFPTPKVSSEGGIRLEEPSGEESREAEASGGGGLQIIGLKRNDWDDTVSWLLFPPPPSRSRSRFKSPSALSRKQKIPSRPICLQRETAAISSTNLGGGGVRLMKSSEKANDGLQSCCRLFGLEGEEEEANESTNK